MIVAATLQCRKHMKASGGYQRAGEPQEGRGSFGYVLQTLNRVSSLRSTN
jgi:hypothetical protein